MCRPQELPLGARRGGGGGGGHERGPPCREGPRGRAVPGAWGGRGAPGSRCHLLPSLPTSSPFTTPTHLPPWLLRTREVATLPLRRSQKTADALRSWKWKVVIFFNNQQSKIPGNFRQCHWHLAAKLVLSLHWKQAGLHTAVQVTKLNPR